ncbi:MAG: DNA helicase UvrD [Candidatus Kerfeldbacteria bacterium]|nr:DNA helicase UvrD [Candidatus Kerfeldbacteria bacterium]
MRIVCDLHLHSKYSRATSRNLDLTELSKWATIKGITLLGTSDFTHPQWFSELEQSLVQDETGFYILRDTAQTTAKLPLLLHHQPIHFVPTVEISCIYSKAGATRRVHVIVVAENLERARAINERLSTIGNIRADGRPILGLDVKELLKIVLDVSDRNLLIPAHVWTPWFAVFGSKSGFDSLEECFEELTPQIFAVETGLSSDPSMNWRMQFLDSQLIVSFSDAHSGAKLGREATVFEMDPLTYDNFYNIFSQRQHKSVIETIEFYPEEGKYHVDGHRECGIRITDPKETKRLNNICPKCFRKLTIGVMHRVEDLASFESGRKSPLAAPFRHIVPLPEIIAEVRGVGISSKRVQDEFFQIIERGGSEFPLLLDVPESELLTICAPEIAAGILKVRNNELHIEPGYDGVFGSVHLFTEEERRRLTPHQSSLL